MAGMWPAGAAYINGHFMPVGEAVIPVTEWGYRRSDVTYDVVSVWDGAFFRLDHHLRRFRASMEYFRLVPPESDADIRAMLHELVRRTGLREAYVAMDCLRGSAPANLRRHPVNARALPAGLRVPYVWLVPQEIRAQGMHLIVASNPRIPEACVNPRAKNFHWADMTRAMFEAEDKGAHNPVLLDFDGNVTEGPGFNVFAVTNGVVATPDRGVLEGITRGAVIELCAQARAALRGAHRAAGGTARRGRDLHLVHRRRRDRRDTAGRAHPVERPARPGHRPAGGRILALPPRRLVQRADRLRLGGRC